MEVDNAPPVFASASFINSPASDICSYCGNVAYAELVVGGLKSNACQCHNWTSDVAGWSDANHNYGFSQEGRDNTVFQVIPHPKVPKNDDSFSPPVRPPNPVATWIGQLHQTSNPAERHPRFGGLQKASMIIPHQPQQTPAHDHFNARGEFIQRSGYEIAPMQVVGALGAPPPHSPARSTPGVPTSVIQQLWDASRTYKGLPWERIAPNYSTRHIDITPSFSHYGNNVRATVIAPPPMLERAYVPSPNDEISSAALSAFLEAENSDTDGDMEIRGMELSYPEPAIGTMNTPLGLTQPRQQQSISSADDRQSVPNKRQKIAHPQIAGLPGHAVTHLQASSPLLPHKKASHKSTLDLCSTEDCAGTIPAQSAATRCPACVRLSWATQKPKRNPSQYSGAAMTTLGVLKAKEDQKRKTKKIVTWADDVRKPPTPRSPSMSAHRDTEATPEIDALRGANLHPLSNCADISTGPSFEQEPPGDDESQPQLQAAIQELGDPRPNGLPSPPDHRACGTTPILEVATDNSTLSPPKPRLLIRIPKELNSLVASGCQSVWPSSSHISGWGSDLSDLSDLSELTDSSVDDESESDTSESSEMESVTESRGLTIRIPARPAIAQTRACASANCTQRFHVKYQWKSCVLCRAKSREYQQKRPNRQTRHSRIDLGGNSEQNRLPGVTEITEPSNQSVVDGARLCSIRSCSFIIPPSSEYRWKECALCRLRSKQGTRPGEDRKSPTAGNLMLHALASGRLKRAPTHLGRCQSLDCGMALQNDEAETCSQCKRRKANLDFEVYWFPRGCRAVITPPQPWYKPRELPPPYPQYKCFSSLLFDFSNRLKDFLQAQAIFYLHMIPDAEGSKAKTAFGFDAEYSIIAMDFDILDRKEDVDNNILTLKREVESACQLNFSHRRRIAVLEGGALAIRFVCIYQAPIIQPSTSANEEQTAAHTCMKRMKGELEFTILADHSHPYFPGQRTVVRFRLVG